MPITIPPNRKITIEPKPGTDDYQSAGLPDGLPPGALAMGTTTKTATSITGVVTDGNGSTSYQVRVDGGSWQSGLTATGLAAETTYSVEWRGVNANGTGPATTPENVTTSAAGSEGISSITGSFSAGSTLTVSGSSLGTTGTSVISDDFEDGVNGDDLDLRGLWTTTSQNGPPVPAITTADAFAGTRCAVADCSAGGDSLAYVTGLAAEEVFISLAVKPVLTSGAPLTTKGVRAHGLNGNLYTGYPGFMDQEPYDDGSSNSHRVQVNKGTASGNNEITYIGAHDLKNGVWYQQEWYFRHSAPGGFDGQLVHKINGVEVVNNVNIQTRLSGVTDKIERVLMPFYWGNGGFGKFFYDLVQVVKGPSCRARFVAADSSSWASRTYEEVLVTSARSDSSATVQVPAATNFSTSQTVYIFAIGADDNPIGDAYSMVVS